MSWGRWPKRAAGSRSACGLSWVALALPALALAQGAPTPSGAGGPAGGAPTPTPPPVAIPALKPSAPAAPGGAPALGAASAPAEPVQRVKARMTSTVDHDPVPIIEGVVARSKVEAVFARGPQYVAASVQVAPAFEDRRFLGFQVLSLTRGSVFADSMGIRPGDIILRVNDESIERPELFMRAWEVVRQAPHIDVRLRREGEDRRYRWRIEP